MRFISLSTRMASLRTSVGNKFTLPERFKGTMVEKWATYWKGLLSDYGDVAAGVVKGAIEKPKKAAFYGISGYGLYQCTKRCPDEDEFFKQFRLATNDMMLVSPALQNPKSLAYLRRIQGDLNQNRLRCLSLGIFSILWEDLYDKDDCTYPAVCEYTQVTFSNFHEHVVDVGFWNQFWRLKWELHNYDVNYL